MSEKETKKDTSKEDNVLDQTRLRPLYRQNILKEWKNRKYLAKALPQFPRMTAVTV